MMASTGSRRIGGFSIVELLIVIVVIAILSAIGYVVYNGATKRSDDARVFVTAQQSTDALETYFVKNRDYPPNLAGVEYAGPSEVALVLYTNAPTIRKYLPGTLNSSQNAQLLLNACNDQMPVTSGGSTYSTGCKFSGQNFHIKGQAATNVVINGPEVTQAEFIADYQARCSNASCTAARNTIIANFIAQGGAFPITVPPGNVAMPEISTVPTDAATKYCIEARSVTYVDVVYHKTQTDTDVVKGECPDNPELKYIP